MRVDIDRVEHHSFTAVSDELAVEEPLEIRVQDRGLSVTMRTPGHDEELAAGFLVTEGVIRRREDLVDLRVCGPTRNVVKATLAPGVAVDWARLERHVYTSSSCGLCGKTSLAAVRALRPPGEDPDGARPRPDEPRLTPELVHSLPARLADAQPLFRQTGGLHATALFSPAGELLVVREDVGRHNALDKVIGHALLAGTLPLTNAVLLVSGRAGFELVQKAVVAGAPVLAAVGAPSSLACELARENGLTLLGFVRGGRFNVYAGGGRLARGVPLP